MIRNVLTSLAHELEIGASLDLAMARLVAGSRNSGARRTAEHLADGLARGDEFADLLGRRCKGCKAAAICAVSETPNPQRLAGCLREVAEELGYWEVFRRRLFAGILAISALSVPVIALVGAMGWAVAIGLLCAGVAISVCGLLAMVRPRFRRGLEEFLLGLPMLGKIFTDASLLRFAEVMGLLLRQGLPPIRALAYASECAPLRLYSEVFRKGVHRLVVGESFREAVSHPLMPVATAKAFAGADERFALAAVMDRVAGEQRRRLEDDVRTLLARVLIVSVAACLVAVFFLMLR